MTWNVTSRNASSWPAWSWEVNDAELRALIHRRLADTGDALRLQVVNGVPTSGSSPHR
ncbi:MAG: hypothetical protein AB8G14_14100 [Ilumatobacter sp.]